ncbi:hypothetical protein M011DRAFT_17420 [Sporormia fimetaria CBS 119925]|uniref:Uncharacterized protein n=1 Tax=Sporormia fimetaria CBS 119925 TaxID=1340428 RepID=A0A6A6VQP5_9PLEO|nr:hypothetical protein M011DRAFT_17420 [Sporormia fimetaria CBS 119925]
MSVLRTFSDYPVVATRRCSVCTPQHRADTPVSPSHYYQGQVNSAQHIIISSNIYQQRDFRRLYTAERILSTMFLHFILNERGFTWSFLFPLRDCYNYYWNNERTKPWVLRTCFTALSSTLPQHQLVPHTLSLSHVPLLLHPSSLHSNMIPPAPTQATTNP